EADLVSVVVAKDCFARPVRVCLTLVGLNPARGDLGNERVQVIDENGDVRPTGPFAVLLDEQVAMLVDLPDGLGRVRDERGLLAQQTLLPGSRRFVVADVDPGEQVESHCYRIRGAGGVSLMPTRGLRCRVASGSR